MFQKLRERVPISILIGAILVLLMPIFGNNPSGLRVVEASEVPSFNFPWDSSLNGKILWTGGPHVYGNTYGGAAFFSGLGSGIDFAGIEGYKHFTVLAMKAGTVIYKGSGGLGNQVAVQHWDGSVLIYGHLASFSSNYNVGSQILQGQAIGIAGSSGTDNIHLHLELRSGGTCTLYCVSPDGVGGNPLGWVGKYIRSWQIFEYRDPNITNTSYNYDGLAIDRFRYPDAPMPYTGLYYADRHGSILVDNRTVTTWLPIGVSCPLTGYCETTSPLLLNGQPMSNPDGIEFAGNGWFATWEDYQNGNEEAAAFASDNVQVGGYDLTPIPEPTSAPGVNWLLEFSKAERPPLAFEIHTSVDTSQGNYSAHRVLVDGQNIGETSTSEQYITWNTYGWADGYHTMRVEYRRVSDNGNWATALAHEEQFYLSPNRAGTAPCDGRDGIQMQSGSDCIILTQTFPALDVIGWKERQPLTVTVRGNFEAWFEYTHQAQVVYSGETRSMGLVTQVELRTPAPPPPPPPSSAFTVDANTVYLFPFNEGSGTQTVDIASGLVGTLGSGVGWVPSQFGSALVFPDAASYGVSTAAFDVCPMTVELWVRKNDTNGNIAGQLGGLNKWSLTFANLRPKLEIWSAGGSQWVTSFQEIQLGTWHYIMFTYDCGWRQAKLYLDNVLVGELTTPAVWNSGAYPLYIGSSNNGNRCRCEIDELRISNVVRVPSTQATATPTIMPSVTASPTPTPTATATETGAVVDSTGTGLLGEYFNGVTLSGPSETRLDPTVNVNTHDSPHPFVGADNFSVKWTGFIEPLYSEPYQICTWSDDGIRVTFNGQLVIDNWVSHGAALDCGSVGNLTAGIEYSITVEYYELGGGAVAQLGWSSPSQQEDLVPQSQLYPASAPAVTNTPVPSDTPVPTATNTPQFTETPTETPTETATSTPTATATDTPVPTETPVPQTDVLLSQGKSTSANTQKAGLEAQKANDGSMETYWEGQDNTNAELTTDLGAVYTVNSVVLKLGWEGRYEEVAIWTSIDGVNFTLAVPAAYYFLGTVQIPILSVQARYVGIEITDNNVVPAAQLAELEVWGR